MANGFVDIGVEHVAVAKGFVDIDSENVGVAKVLGVSENIKRFQFIIVMRNRSNMSAVF